MDIQTITAQINEQAKTVAPLGATLKLAVDDQCIYVDGTGDENLISNENKDADCMISTNIETFQKLLSGNLNPMMAVMTGKIKIKGDMSVAMKLKALVGG